MKPVAPSFVDRAIAAIAPSYGIRRYQARMALNFTGQYAGAKSNRSALKAWSTFAGSADTDSLGDLPTLRARSRDLMRNTPIATGARKTSKANVVGTGLKVRSNINRELLGLSEPEAEAWEAKVETLFDLWAKSKSADITRTQNFYALQGLIYLSTFESGDAFVLRRTPSVKGSIVPLALGVIEADRVATPPVLMADPFIRSGVRVDDDFAPQSYFVSRIHPGEMSPSLPNDFDEIPAIGEKSGEAMVLHIFDRQRPDQTRGVPFLAPVIESLKQLDRFTEAELMAAVVSSFFTVFMKTDTQDGLAGATPPLPGMGKDEITLGSGSVIDIGKDEDIQIAQSSRPNSNFSPFVDAIIRQIGVALSIPYELLIMHFTASYSASRAAIEMASQFFLERRQFVIDQLCQPVYEWFIASAINTGLIAANGFFTNPVARAAWCGSLWVGPPPLILDPGKEWDGADKAIGMGARTLEEVTLQLTGGDWKKKTEQRGREHAARVAQKLEPEILDPSARENAAQATSVPAPGADGQDPKKPAQGTQK